MPTSVAALRRESLDGDFRVPTDFRVGFAPPELQNLPVSDGDESDFVTGYKFGKVCDFIPMLFLGARYTQQLNGYSIFADGRFEATGPH